MLETLGLSKRQARPVDDARVNAAVEHNGVVAPNHRRDRPQVRLIARREGEGGRLIGEAREARLKLLVKIEGAVHQPRAGTSRAVALDRPDRRFFDARILSQSEVVVRTQHDQATATDDDLRARLGLERDEEGIAAHFLDLARPRQRLDLIEEVCHGPRDLLSRRAHHYPTW